MTVKNILFIMCDQLRWDYLSCEGHPHLQTPNIDKLAERGVRFTRTYVQSPLCCPSRASTYTGRYMSSHGASVNFASLRPDELGLGDYLNPLGVRTALIGKTHSFPDLKAFERLGIDRNSELGTHLANIGFEPIIRDDGLHPNDERSKNIAYNRYLRENGYDAINPWHTHANGAYDENGDWLSGWFLKAGNYPANIEEPHSETPFTTKKAMAFMEEAGDDPWCLHLSYIKPHWPYIVPAPYHEMYDASTFLPLVREEDELDNPNPVYEAFTQMDVSRGFQRPEAREAVLKAYMGLIKQIDDQLGNLFTFMDEKGLSENTMIVFTSDHGDYLGDHWMGEKSWFHDCSVKVPMIIVDPSPEADPTRGTSIDALTESIDLVPTFIDTLGGQVPVHRLEGRSLRPLLTGHKPEDWRTFAVSEVDYSDRGAKYILGTPDQECNTVMICTDKWKYIYIDNYPPQLFDLENDPHELNDLGRFDDHKAVIAEMQQHLIQFLIRRKHRVSLNEEQIANLVKPPNRERRGIYIGYYDQHSLPEAVKREKGIN